MTGERFGGQNPYQPPRVPDVAEVPVSYSAQPVRGLCVAFICLIGLVLLIDINVLTILSGLHDVYGDLAANRNDRPWRLFDLSVGMGSFKIAWVFTMIPCTALWWIWTVRAAKNVRVFGAKSLMHPPASMVWWWFVPVLNLIRPHQAIVEVWKASVAAARGRSEAWASVPAPKFLLLWWTLTLISVVMVPVTWWQGAASFSHEVAKANTVMQGGACVVEMTAAVLALVVVASISRMQTRVLEQGPRS